MRTNEERIAVMHERAAQIKKTRNIQFMSAAAVLLCVVLIAIFLPVVEMTKPEMIPTGMNASIFYESNYLGSIVVALLSFLLGVAFTIFCFYLRKLYGRNDG